MRQTDVVRQENGCSLEGLAESRIIGHAYVRGVPSPFGCKLSLAARLGLANNRDAKPYGLMVVSVEVDGPAHKAGVLQGDVLTAWDGQPVRRLRDVLERIGPDSVGQTATLSIVRAGQPASAQVTIVERHVA
jgi:S1-C subfamily serine protease